MSDLQKFSVVAAVSAVIMITPVLSGPVKYLSMAMLVTLVAVSALSIATKKED